jgi:hypothetical protein
MSDEIEISDLGRAVVESGLTVRQAHEIRTGCSTEAPCAQCLRDFGAETAENPKP